MMKLHSTIGFQDGFKWEGSPIETAAPNWEPLEKWVLGQGKPIADCNAWMWMYSKSLGGVRFEAYKHRDTREYMLLDVDGCAFKAVSA